MIPTLSSLVALDVVIITASSAPSDDKVGIMETLRFRSFDVQYSVT